MPQPTRVYTDDEFANPHFDDPLLDGDISSTRDERTLAVIAHLSSLVGFGLIAPLVIYLVKKEDSAFVADQAKEALNFHITVLLAILASVVLMIVLIGLILLPVVAIGASILSIVAAIRANDGEVYRYPFTLRLV